MSVIHITLNILIEGCISAWHTLESFHGLSTLILKSWIQYQYTENVSKLAFALRRPYHQLKSGKNRKG